MEALEGTILAALSNSEEFGDCSELYNSQFQAWMNNCVGTIVFNIQHVLSSVRPRNEDEYDTTANQDFKKKMQWWQSAVKRLSKSATRGIGWQKKALSASFERDSGSCLVWIPAEAKIQALSGFDNQGGYGRVRKVRIYGLDQIPDYIHFAGKVHKASTAKERRIQRSVEALACPINHPGIIKFWAIHAESMEAYTLWWNGESMRDMFTLNSKVSPSFTLENIMGLLTLSEEQRKRITLFRKNSAKLAWALVYVASLVHKASVLHNDLSPSNVLLHFPSICDTEIYIGICDWGIASRLHEGAPSHYGYPNEEETRKHMRSRWWVAPELFYTFGPPKSETSIEQMQMVHKYTIASDSFSIGKLASRIHSHHVMDRDMFRDETCMRYFEMKISELCELDPKKRPTCGQVVNHLMAAPWNLTPPEAVFRSDVLD